MSSADLARRGHLTGAVDEVARREDDRILGQRTQAGAGRRRSATRRGTRPRDAFPAAPPRRAAAAPKCGPARRRRDDHETLGTGLQAKRELERLRRIEVDGLADDIRRKRNALQLVDWHRDMNDGHAREHAVAELDREWKRLRRRGDDDADVALAVLLSQKLRLAAGVGFRGRTTRCRDTRKRARPGVGERRARLFPACFR